jgi:MFS family permease
MDDAAQPVGYVALVRGNPNYRRLWLGSVVSLLGDWFNTIALYALVLQLSGSAVAIGAVFITKMLPWALVSPIAGLIVDRYDRRRLMIGADLVRAVIVLGFILIDEPGEVPLIYVLTAAQVVVGSVFPPAQSASIPNITTGQELLTANALSAATWSTILAVGAALGGLATEWLGLRTVFVLDSLSYLWSAWFIARTVIPQSTERPSGRVSVGAAAREVLDGWRFMRSRPEVGRMAFAKAAWAAAGGALVYMLTLIGEAIAPTSAAFAIGLLFSARGLGTGIGPIVVRMTARDRGLWPAIIGACIGVTGVSYFLVGLVGFTYAVVTFVVIAHATSGANWVLSTVLLQERTEDRWRGRVFATEWLLLMATEAASILAASLLLDTGVLGLREAILLFAGLETLAGVLWVAFVVPRERRWAAGAATA